MSARLAGLLTSFLLAACAASPTGQRGDGAATSADAGAAIRQPVTLVTDDGVHLAAYLVTCAMAPRGAPGVVLVHQFRRDDLQWGDLPEVLCAHGYRVLAFDLRGHGQSEPYGGASLDGLLTDPDAAPRDVGAALRYLAGDGGAAAQRIALVGTSIGANLSVAAAIADLATTYVALSARIAPSESLAGAPATGMRSVFYLAGADDPGGQAGDAQTLYDATAEPRAIDIVAGSSAHGIALLADGGDVRERILVWLDGHL